MTPHRFRTKRQFWSYCGLGIVTRSSSLVAALLDGFILSGFGTALRSLVVSVVGSLVSWTIVPSGRFEVLVIDRR